MSELEEVKQRLLNLLEHIAKEIRPCRACGTPLYFVQHESGRLAPYTAEGLNHFANCPQAERFR
jgi:uncharacterized protein with PIN domain